MAELSIPVTALIKFFYGLLGSEKDKLKALRKACDTWSLELKRPVEDLLITDDPLELRKQENALVKLFNANDEPNNGKLIEEFLNEELRTALIINHFRA
jgi:hypothetical protein